MKIVLVAEESAGVRALKLLAALPGQIVAVCTGAERAGVRGAAVAEVARGMGLEVLPAREVTGAEFAGRISSLGADLLINVHSLYRIHQAVLEAPRIGSFNLHPGPLPAFAGLNAPSWALFLGEQRHAVTLHWIASAIDRGDIAWEEGFAIGPADTALSLSARCLALGLPLVERLVKTAQENPAAIPRRPQDPALWRSFGRQVPNGGWVDWSWPAEQVARFVRACDYGPLVSPWGRARSRCARGALEILAATPAGPRPPAPPGTVALGSGAALVAAADGWIELGRINLEGRAVDAPAVLADGELLGGPE